MKYRLEYKPSVKKDLRKIPAKELQHIMRKIEALADNPQPVGVTKLTGSYDLYRIRHGDYRVIYQINDGQLVILVIKIGHRKDVYDKI